MVITSEAVFKLDSSKLVILKTVYLTPSPIHITAADTMP